MALLAAGRRGAAAAGPPCGGSLRPGPRSVPRLPRARPLRGSAPGRTRWGAWAAPAVGGGPLSPARAPGGAARGPLLGVRGSPCSPPVGPAPTRGARPAIPPSAALGPFLGGGAPAAPPPARGGSRLFRAGPVRCLALLPPALPPAALAPSPSRPPPPPGAGEAQEVDARCGGDGRRPPTLARKKASPPVAPATCEKAQNTYFVQLYICPQNPPSLKGFLKKSNCRPPAGSAAHAGIHAQLRAGHKTRRFRQS